MNQKALPTFSHDILLEPKSSPQEAYHTSGQLPQTELITGIFEMFASIRKRVNAGASPTLWYEELPLPRPLSAPSRSSSMICSAAWDASSTDGWLTRLGLYV